MPRYSKGNNDWVAWLILAVIVIVVISLIGKFITENPWVRWFIFVGFTALLIYCIRNITLGFRTQNINNGWIVSIVGALISIIIVVNQVNFFETWWPPGGAIVSIVYGFLGAWILFLVGKWMWRWWKGRSNGGY